MSSKDDLRAFRILHLAISEVKYPVEQLDIGCCCTGVAPSMLVRRTNAWPYSHLTKLDLTISHDVWLNKSDLKHLPRGTHADLAGCFTSLLCYAPNIEYFSLSTDNPDLLHEKSETVFLLLLNVLNQLEQQGHPVFPALQSFRLFCLFVRLEMLLIFLDIMGSRLNKLLLDCVVEYNMTVSKVIEEVRNAPGCHNLELCIDHSYDAYMDGLWMT